MHLASNEVEKLKSIIALCRQVGIEVVVIAEGKVLGANEARNLAIISETDFIQSTGLKLGIGRVSELEKRLSLFSEADATIKSTDKGEISVITLSSGRTKAQFRCTGMALLERRYPRGNNDEQHVVVTLSKNEVSQFTKAARVFSSAKVVMKVDAVGTCRIECADSVNDQFVMDLEKPVSFVAEDDAAVFTYVANNFCQAIDLAAKDLDEVDLVIGKAGSITVLVKGHTLVLAPSVNEE